MSVAEFMGIFTEIFEFMRSNGITIGDIYISIMDFLVWCMFAGIIVDGILYILKGE
ncbi:MAG: hypothetical protein K6F35_07990 [Lachnospiraceae bacterium]|nr:hypothetical protein [Lachnospiraceae bacterium]